MYSSLFYWSIQEISTKTNNTMSLKQETKLLLSPVVHSILPDSVSSTVSDQEPIMEHTPSVKSNSELTERLASPTPHKHKKINPKTRVRKKATFNAFVPPDHVDDKHFNKLKKALFTNTQDAINQVYMNTTHSDIYNQLSDYIDRKTDYTRYATEKELNYLDSVDKSKHYKEKLKLQGKWKSRAEHDEERKEKERLALVKQLVHYSDNNNVCDGCEIDSPTESNNESQKMHFAIKEMKTSFSRFFVNGEEISDFTPEIITDESPFDVTAICVTTANRLIFLPHILYRWPGKLIIVLNGPISEQQSLLNYIETHYLPPRVLLILYLIVPLSDGTIIFPINTLRNLAVKHCSTSHYLLLDMDLWPSRTCTMHFLYIVNTYDQIQLLPSFIKMSTRSAVILPTFFYKRDSFLTRCSSLRSCFTLGLQVFPPNKTELVSCLHSGFCYTNKNSIRTHVYVMPEWYTTPKTSVVSKIECFLVDMQEPYVLVPNRQSTPLFDEHFINYGYNKVQFIEHLRAAGFEFYILNHAFAMDMPHEDSKFRQNYICKATRERLTMRSSFASFLNRVNRQYKKIKRFPICYGWQDHFYTPIY